MFLSQVIRRRRARSRDGYALHQGIWSLFEGVDARPFLYRMTDEPTEPVIVLSRVAPSPSGGWSVRSREFSPVLRRGDRLAFSLRASPTIKRDGKRHDVVMNARTQGDVGSREELARTYGTRWLLRKLEGCEVEEHEVVVTNYTRRRLNFRRNIVVSTCDFDGLLTVSEPETFLNLLFHGVGPAKGFGCGLLLVRRV